MKRLLPFLALACAALLAACVGMFASPAPMAAPPVALAASAAVRGGMDVVGTLSTNACEAAVAADYTAVIVARRQAAALLRAGVMPVADATSVQREADVARAALDAACPGGKPDAARIDSARKALARIRSVMGAN